MPRTKRTLLQRIQKHEADRDYALSRVARWNEAAERHERLAQKLRAEADEVADRDPD